MERKWRHHLYEQELMQMNRNFSIAQQGSFGGAGGGVASLSSFEQIGAIIQIDDVSGNYQCVIMDSKTGTISTVDLGLSSTEWTFFLESPVQNKGYFIAFSRNDGHFWGMFLKADGTVVDFVDLSFVESPYPCPTGSSIIFFYEAESGFDSLFFDGEGVTYHNFSDAENIDYVGNVGAGMGAMADGTVVVITQSAIDNGYSYWTLNKNGAVKVFENNDVYHHVYADVYPFANFGVIRMFDAHNFIQTVIFDSSGKIVQDVDLTFTRFSALELAYYGQGNVQLSGYNDFGPVSTVYDLSGTGVTGASSSYTLGATGNGFGTLAYFDISVSAGGSYSVSVVGASAGDYWRERDEINITGDKLGGVSPDNDLTFYVQSIVNENDNWYFFNYDGSSFSSYSTPRGGYSRLSTWSESFILGTTGAPIFQGFPDSSTFLSGSYKPNGVINYMYDGSASVSSIFSYDVTYAKMSYIFQGDTGGYKEHIFESSGTNNGKQFLVLSGINESAICSLVNTGDGNLTAMIFPKGSTGAPSETVIHTLSDMHDWNFCGTNTLFAAFGDKFLFNIYDGDAGFYYVLDSQGNILDSMPGANYSNYRTRYNSLFTRNWNSGSNYYFNGSNFEEIPQFYSNRKYSDTTNYNNSNSSYYSQFEYKNGINDGNMLLWNIGTGHFRILRGGNLSDEISVGFGSNEYFGIELNTNSILFYSKEQDGSLAFKVWDLEGNQTQYFNVGFLEVSSMQHADERWFFNLSAQSGYQLYVISLNSSSSITQQNTSFGPFFNDFVSWIPSLEPSDIRFKNDIQKVETTSTGINIYSYKFNDDMKKPGTYEGVIAQELVGTRFENALLEIDGFYFVDYNRLPNVKFKKIQ